MSGDGIVDWGRTAAHLLSFDALDGEVEGKTAPDLLIIDDPVKPDWNRNQFTFFAEAYGIPQTPEQRARWKAEHEAWQREQRKLRNRARRIRNFIRNRARDTWGVLLHGLPERDF